MAKKTAQNKTTVRRTTTTRTYSIPTLCAFWGVVLSAVAMFIGFFIKLLDFCGVTISWANTLMGVCSMISMIALLIAVAFPAYNYVRGRNRNWKIVFYASIVLYICGIIGIGFTF